MGQQSGENDRYDRGQQNRLKHPHRQGKHRQLADGNTQDSSVRQPLCAVQCPLGQRLRIADALAFPLGQRLSYLHPVRGIIPPPGTHPPAAQADRGAAPGIEKENRGI